jgi:4-hydroxy-tetrahydrodipicolinate synthase
MELRGCFTALVTPFKGSGVNPPFDEQGFRALLRAQAPVAGIVPCGTTGESPVLSKEEHERIVEIAVEEFSGTVIAGTGGNCTRKAIESSEHAQNAGAHALLQVCPYYNKPNQEGLFKHFGAVAEAVDLPIILYNVPGRTSREIAPETMARLEKEYSNIVGVKEATGKPEVWKKIRELCSKDFVLLSGNDQDTLKMMQEFGGAGVISVASNVIPARMQKFVEMGLEKDFSGMKKEHEKLLNFFDTLFIDTNPIMVKEAMNLLEMPAGGFRLPLCETSDANRQKMKEVIAEIAVESTEGARILEP